MQIKEYEAYTLKECLQQVRDDLGPEAVILETRKTRKGGVLGMGAREAVCIVAATGISVKGDVPARPRSDAGKEAIKSTGRTSGGTLSDADTSSKTLLSRALAAAIDPNKRNGETIGKDVSSVVPQPTRQSKSALSAESFTKESSNRSEQALRAPSSAGQNAAVAAARNAYARTGSSSGSAAAPVPTKAIPQEPEVPVYVRNNPRANASQVNSPLSKAPAHFEDEDEYDTLNARQSVSRPQSTTVQNTPLISPNNSQTSAKPGTEDRRFALLEKAMHEIREGLNALHIQQKESHERTVSAVVSAVTPALAAAGNMAHLTSFADAETPRFPDLYARLIASGVSSVLAHDLLDALPDFGAWSEEAQEPLAVSALRDLIARRVCSYGPIELTPGTLKAVALIGPTGVGKTTTIAKLAAHFALVEKKRVALLTMDTYRIAAVEQLKIYSQILDIPIGVAYSQAEVVPVVAQYADYDLLLIDTAGRSQKNIMQVGELKSLLEIVGCETHLVLSAQTKESDMIEAAQRFSAARVDRLIFSKLDETDSYGTLLNVADHTGIPLSYLTTGQKVPEDLESANGSKLANLLLN